MRKGALVLGFIVLMLLSLGCIGEEPQVQTTSQPETTQPPIQTTIASQTTGPPTTLIPNPEPPLTIPPTTVPPTTEPPNNPPIAIAKNISVDYSEDSIILDASESRDEDGSIVEYRWNIGGEEFTSKNPSLEYHLKPEKIGNISCELSVIDDKGAVSTAEFFVELKLPKVLPGQYEKDLVDLAYDDGEMDLPTPGFNKAQILLVTPTTTPWILDKVRVFGAYYGEDKEFIIEIWDKDLNELYTSGWLQNSEYFAYAGDEFSEKASNLDWAEIDVPDMIMNDNFYVVIDDLSTLDSGIYVGTDNDAPISGRFILNAMEIIGDDIDFYYPNYKNAFLEEKGKVVTKNIMIRPVGYKLTTSIFDEDGDRLTKVGELEIGTDPLNPDTDGDGLLDNEDPEPLKNFKKIINAKEYSSFSGFWNTEMAGRASATYFTPLTKPWFIDKIEVFGTYYKKDKSFIVEILDKNFNEIYNSGWLKYSEHFNLLDTNVKGWNVSWAEVNIPNLELNDDFYLVIYQNNDFEGYIEIWMDEDPPFSERSYWPEVYLEGDDVVLKHDRILPEDKLKGERSENADWKIRVIGHTPIG